MMLLGLLLLAQIVIGCLGIAWGITCIVVGVLGLGVYNEMSATELAIRVLNVDTAFGVARLILAVISIATGIAGLRSTGQALRSADDAAAERAAEVFQRMYFVLSIANVAIFLAGSVKLTMWMESLNLGVNNMMAIIVGGKWLAFVILAALRSYFCYVIWSFKTTMSNPWPPPEVLVPPAMVVDAQP